MKSYIKRGMIIFILIFSIQSTLAAGNFTHVIVNSEDWKDAFSALHYANLKGVDSTFLVSTLGGSIALDSIDKSNTLKVISSKKNPYVFNYPEMIRSKGFAGVEEITTDNANIDLMKDLPDITNFIIVGDSYGYNAIATVPYAVSTRSWIFLANKKNIYAIDAVLSKITNKKILVYGFVDKEVTDTISKYSANVVTINTGDKFKDNIEIVKKYSENKQVKQVILTNGELIEKEVMKGLEPILYTGKDNVPTVIGDFIKSSNISVGVLIGNELVGAATNIRRTTGMSVMVKFARGARTQTGGVAEVEGLDIFPVPTPSLNLTIYSINYNKVTSELQVTYKSTSNAPLYLKGTITLISGDGSRNRVGDLNPIFVAPGDFKTISYSVTTASSENMSAEISTLYGETITSLDRVLNGKLNVNSINILDKCKLTKENVKQLVYNKQAKNFIITIENAEDVDCWVDVELNNIYEGYTTKTLSPEGSLVITSKKTKDIIINEDLSDTDLAKNSMIDMTVYSGEKENNLVYSFQGNFPLKIQNWTTMTYVAMAIGIIVIILVIIVIILYLIKRRRKDDEEL